MAPYKRLICLVLVALGLMLSSRSTEAAKVPQLSGRVNDYAAMLSPATRQQLENVLARLEKEESTQIALLTITSLEGAVLEEYALKVAEAWRLGQKGRDNGALLLIAKNDRKLRIEVGYGLEGRLTDLTAGRIIRDTITPRFREGNFDLGVSDGVAAMIAAVHGEYQGQDATVATSSSSNAMQGLIAFAIFVFFCLIRIFIGSYPWITTCIGGIIAPVIGLHLELRWLLILGLIPAGLLAGYLISLLFGVSFSSRRYSGTFGGFSSGGGSSGFSGGGGGFGGGGSSGGW